MSIPDIALNPALLSNHDVVSAANTLSTIHSLAVVASSSHHKIAVNESRKHFSPSNIIDFAAFLSDVRCGGDSHTFVIRRRARISRARR